MRRSLVRSSVLSGVALTVGASVSARAQNPVTLPPMTVTATPGARVMAGVVRDTADARLAGVEVTIAERQRRTITKPDGSFRFEDLGRGTYELRARMIGYAPQVRKFRVDSAGGLADFALIPLARALPPMLTTVARGGLSGIVADTAFDPIPGATVKVLGAGLSTTTDDAGAFFLPARPGSYMVSVSRPSFHERLVSVRIPSDSGRHIAVSLLPGSKAESVREAWNVADLADRSAKRKFGYFAMYTRDDIEQQGIEWLQQMVAGGAIRAGFKDPVSANCSAIVNGGPKVAKIKEITADEVESVEVYASSGAMGFASQGRTDGIVRMGRLGVSDSRTNARISNLDHAASANRGMSCPIVYVWLR